MPADTDTTQIAITPGEKLKRAREQMGLSVDTVARELHLSVTQIHALENDDHSDFHGETYVRGYLRVYAKLVGVEPDQILMPSQPAAAESQPPTQQPPVSGHGRLFGVAAITMMVIGVIFWWYGYRDKEFFDAADVAMEDRISSSSSLNAKQRPQQSSRIILELMEQSWVDVRDGAGQRLVYADINAGRTLAIDGRPPFHVYLGNAAGVRLQYNGAPFDITSHQQGLYARFVINERSVRR